MRAQRMWRSSFGVGVAVAMGAAVGRAPASGASVTPCVPAAAGGAGVWGGSAGTWGAATTKVAMPADAGDQQTLLSLLSHLSYIVNGVGGRPTIRFTGVNVQVVSGSGATDGAVNGAGNLVVGYA